MCTLLFKDDVGENVIEECENEIYKGLILTDGLQKYLHFNKCVICSLTIHISKRKRILEKEYHLYSHRFHLLKWRINFAVKNRGIALIINAKW